jgi:hypothetical protein
MNDQRVREKFEAFITASPYEKSVRRYDSNGMWPFAYVDIDVHLAWDAWQAAWREGMLEAAGICDANSFVKDGLLDYVATVIRAKVE